MPVQPDWINFHFPTKVHLEMDCGYKIGSFTKNIGSRIVIITTQKEMENPDELSIIKTSIEKHSDGVIIYDDIEDKATFKNIDTASHFCKQSQANCIIAYGSYESINAAKAIAALSTNDLFAEDMILHKQPIKNKPMPLIIIPTSPVLGIECAPYLTIIDERDKQRKFIANPLLFPELIICDPKISNFLTSTDISKAGTSIIAAAVDTILSKYSNDLTNSSSLKAIELISKNLIPSTRDTKNIIARNSLFAASVLAGMSQSTSSLGLCYALSLAAITLTKLDIFQAMSIMLPHVMEYNLTSSAGKYVMIAKSLDEDITDISVIEAAIKAVEGIRKIYLELKIPQRLSEFEVKKIDLPGIATLASSYSFLDCLPRELPKNEIETILVAAF